MRRLFSGATLIIIALVIGLPFLLSRQIPARFFPGVTIVRVYLHQENRVAYMQLEDYLVGVVGAEMPAEFPLEALKAQAVAARTYVVKRISAGGVENPLHAGADVCDDHRHGQAWLPREELKKRWACTLHNYYTVKKAVDETRGQALTYQGELIDAAYHASCGGRTENAEDVWKYQVPYLKSVPCPYDSDPDPVQTVSFSFEQVDQALGTSLAAVPAAGKEKAAGDISWLKKQGTGRTQGPADRQPPISGGGGEGPARTAIHKIYRDSRAIPSPLPPPDTGTAWLCQYGAKGMDGHGYNYRIILGHYYSGAEIMK
jgi:stage II sporulation protein D